MSASQPWLKFYPTDWRADQALRVCSLAARGLWMEMLCIMHEATPYGHLTINGRPTTDAQLASLTGTDLSTVRQLTTELEEAGVFSRNRNGVIYSRRMTRDEKRRKDGKKAEEIGGMVPRSRRSQAVEKSKKKSPPPGVWGGVGEKPPITPEARSQIPEPTNLTVGGLAVGAATTTAPDDLIAAFNAVLVETWGEGARRRGPHCTDQGTAEDWVAAGVMREAAEAVFRDCFARMKARPRGKPPFSMAPFGDDIRRALVSSPPSSPRTSTDDAAQWRNRLIGFRDRGLWLTGWGPKPGENGCEAPRDLVAEILPHLVPGATVVPLARARA